MTRAPDTTRPWSWARWWQDVIVPRAVIVGHIPLAGTGLVTGLLAVNILLGLAPVGFVVGSAQVVGRVGEVVRDGVGSAAWDALVAAFLLASGCFAAQQALIPVQAALGELVRRRVDGVVHDRLIGIALRSTSIGPMEESDTLDTLAEAHRQLDTARHTPGMACAGMLALVARYLRLLGLVWLVGQVTSWLSALALFAAVMVFRYGQRGGMRTYAGVWREVAPAMRRGDYLRGVATGPGAAKELRVFGLTPWLSERYADNYLSWTSAVATARRRVFLLPYLAYTAIGLAVGVIVLVAVARSAAAGEIGLTELVLAAQAVIGALLLGEHYAEADLQTTFGIRSAMGGRRFDELVRAGEPEQRPVTAALPPDAPTTAVHFDRVSFHYRGSERPVLDGLDLRLPAGKCTAVVGVNGAGKTTLVKLLTRLYEPTEGEIRVDGTDVRDLGVAEWRRRVSVIFQDFIRYELSAADNIALGAPHAPRDDVALRRAARLAGIGDVLDGLPSGLDTPLARAYEGGVDLSGGQWQRVAIARSLYALRAGARVLVLDEPTSALDVRAEAEFFDRFVELTRGVTSLLISHRFSSVRRADWIVVLDGGRVVERGTHDELMAADGHYPRLFRLQAERFAAGLDADGELIDTTAEATT